MVSNRESDIYTVMCKTIAAGCDFLIRSVHDRPVDCDVEEGRMGIKEYMESLPVSHTYNLHLRGHKGRKARTAKMTLRFAEVTIHKGKKCRWFIEELFRVCKSEGFRIESVQLESGAAVKKLIVLTMYAALRCVTLKRAYDEQDESIPANRMFDEQEMELFKVEMEYLYRKSPKALDGRNLFRENSLPWAA